MDPRPLLSHFLPARAPLTTTQIEVGDMQIAKNVTGWIEENAAWMKDNTGSRYLDSWMLPTVDHWMFLLVDFYSYFGKMENDELLEAFFAVTKIYCDIKENLVDDDRFSAGFNHSYYQCGINHA
ncbi:hypothetical protein N7490_007735 [Penicillium lividum]|nr:hypothetical protein N7490_007735 [Penicillium lividum]